MRKENSEIAARLENFEIDSDEAKAECEKLKSEIAEEKEKVNFYIFFFN